MILNNYFSVQRRYERLYFLYILQGLNLAHAESGTPGSVWTEDELLAAKAKIIWILKNPQKALEEVGRTFVSSQNKNYTGKLMGVMGVQR